MSFKEAAGIILCFVIAVGVCWWVEARGGAGDENMRDMPGRKGNYP